VFTLTRLRLPIAVIVGLAVATLLALAAFTSAEAAEQKDAAAKEPTDAATTEGTVPETTDGPITIENHAWDKYHWARMSNPFTLQLGDNVAPAWDDYLRIASTDWTTSSVLDTTKVTGLSSAKRCPATTGRVEVCNDRYGRNGWLGIATIWVSGDHITKGTTKLNDSYYNTSTYDTPAWRSLVMCQEVGHTFGLGHQDENFNNQNLNTCMDYANDPTSNQHPNQGDYDELLCIYDPATKGKTLSTPTHSCTGTGHLDGTSTVGSTSGTSARDNIPGDDPPAWGKEIFRSADGRLSVFEKDLGNDTKKVTHVFWTEERAKEHRGDEDEPEE
jgi:hypothetical protein